MTRAGADFFGRGIAGTGAIVTGRRLLDFTDGWGGAHPVGVPGGCADPRDPTVWIDAHPGAAFTFVTEGVEAALAAAQELAGGKAVGVAGPNVAQQCLDLGLLDDVVVGLVPVLLGTGIRYFDGGAAATLEDPEVVPGRRVTHLRYRVRR